MSNKAVVFPNEEMGEKGPPPRHAPPPPPPPPPFGRPAPFVTIAGSSTVHVERDQWKTCVLPVLEDPAYVLFKTPFGSKAARGRLYAQWQVLIGKALEKQFKANGF